MVSLTTHRDRSRATIPCPKSSPPMALQSMTGFGSASGIVASATIRFEIKSVNGRGLDLRFRLPSGIDHLEPVFRDAVRRRISRGSVNVSCTLGGTDNGVSVNRALLKTFCDEARVLEAQGFGTARSDSLLALRGVLESGETSSLPDGDEDRTENDPQIAAIFTEALQQLVRVRKREGEQLAAMVADQTRQIAELTSQARKDPARSPDAIARRLATQVERLTGASSALDPARLHAEAALIATRADIQEELDRIEAHCDAIRILFDSDEAVGRRLDFLAQELGREANTLCSKASTPGIGAIGLDMKVIVDQLREQAQNVE